MTSSEPIHVVTGAAGGIGFECARRLGHRGALVLADREREPLDAIAAKLAADGYLIEATVVGDLADPGEALALAAALDDRPLGALVHAAGLSPSLADGRTVFDVNLVATDALLRAFLPHAVGGSVAICVASTAGHAVPEPTTRVLRLLDDPDRPALFDALLAATNGAIVHPQVAYALSKLAVIRLCRREAATWGAAGARLLSVSPGLIDTPMGRAELSAEPQVREIVTGSALKRLGTPREIAAAVDWLASPAASYVTGTDVVLDGGALAGAERAAAPAAAAPATGAAA
ncbi:SDR family oxidoreductase [Conexibacter stalactiti]|uniref:SDR family oxidoreductase n=1 Tax=Conexibacter stalactiti TaxID=1940611 RepID=A0ABU4HRP2_9ACTN|nr:SDR family oxidoreductase [Conexibacter stalactiti]MDW5594724.1 SDR family oxidoreductase [Conexibacter stalactiti]MEC5035366.1 SDR family oxidoreductase [Conexibacter stalactiti]